MSSSEKEKSIINYSFLNIESGIVNRLHIDLILSVIAAARFQIQTEQDILDQEQELPVSLVRQYSVRIKFFLRRTILLDNMVTPEKERLLNTVSSFVRSKKQNTLMAYWRSNLETYSKKLHALKVLPVRCFFNC